MLVLCRSIRRTSHSMLYLSSQQYWQNILMVFGDCHKLLIMSYILPRGNETSQRISYFTRLSWSSTHHVIHGDWNNNFTVWSLKLSDIIWFEEDEGDSNTFTFWSCLTRMHGEKNEFFLVNVFIFVIHSLILLTCNVLQCRVIRQKQ